MNTSVLRSVFFMLLAAIGVASLSGCKAWIEFDIWRTKVLFIVFILTLLIGVIGMLFSNKSK